MAEDKVILTRTGYERLQAELEQLSTEGREGLASQLAELRDDTAVEDEAILHDLLASQDKLEERIATIQRVLAAADIVDEDPDPQTASPGDRVIVWDFAEQDEIAFDLLGSAEVAFGRQGVSIESPVGKALLNRKIGDVVEVMVPDGKVKYAIRRFERIPE